MFDNKLKCYIFYNANIHELIEDKMKVYVYTPICVLYRTHIFFPSQSSYMKEMWG